MTGLDGRGNKINNTKLVMEVSQLAKELNDVDYLRLMIIYLSQFQMSANDKSTMLKSLNHEKHRTIVKNLEYLDEKLVDSEKQVFRRRFVEMSKEDFIEHQRLRSSSEFEILRTEPKICRLIKHIHNGTMDEKVYPFVEPPKSK